MLKGQPSARVAIPSGDLYPSGLTVIPANPNVQQTVRPEGWLFRGSQGFPTVRPGENRYQDGHHGMGIGFTPLRYAEDITRQGEPGGVPAMVDQDNIPADITDIPGSGMLTSEGLLDPDFVADNRGTLHSKGKGFPSDDGTGRDPHRTPADMGDREGRRPLTSAYWFGYVKDPTRMFRSEWQQNPVMALAVAGVGITVAYIVGRDFEKAWANRRRSSPERPLVEDAASHPVKTVATAPVAAVETAAETAKKTTDAAAEAVEGAAEAVKDVGKAVEDTAKEVADAVTN